jgi:hypothetical protein
MKRGRPKGYTPYIEMTQKELSHWIGKKTKIPISRKWLEFIMGDDISNYIVDDVSENEYDNSTIETQTENEPIENESKIEYNLTKF